MVTGGEAAEAADDGGLGDWDYWWWCQAVRDSGLWQGEVESSGEHRSQLVGAGLSFSANEMSIYPYLSHCLCIWWCISGLFWSCYQLFITQCHTNSRTVHVKAEITLKASKTNKKHRNPRVKSIKAQTETHTNYRQERSSRKKSPNAYRTHLIGQGSLLPFLGILSFAVFPFSSSTYDIYDHAT